MSSQSLHNPVDLAPTERARPGLALALALISVPGVTIAWDLSPVAGVAGTAIGITAIAIGLKARTGLAGARGTRMATAAIAIAALAVLSVGFFLIVGPPD